MSHFALVNILAGRTVVPELLQGEASPARMAAEAERLLSDPAAREAQLRGLVEVRRTLGEPGAPRRVAEEVAAFLPQETP
jgi:lipid-A-disaccharide synthase